MAAVPEAELLHQACGQAHLYFSHRGRADRPGDTVYEDDLYALIPVLSRNHGAVEKLLTEVWFDPMGEIVSVQLDNASIDAIMLPAVKKMPTLEELAFREMRSAYPFAMAVWLMRRQYFRTGMIWPGETAPIEMQLETTFRWIWFLACFELLPQLRRSRNSYGVAVALLQALIKRGKGWDFALASAIDDAANRDILVWTTPMTESHRRRTKGKVRRRPVKKGTRGPSS